MKLKLTSILILIFSGLGGIEGFFLGALCEDVLKADSKAKDEFKVVKISQDISSGLIQFYEVLGHLWSGDPVKEPRMRKLEQTIDSTCKESAELNENIGSIKSTIRSVFEVFEARDLQEPIPNPYQEASLEVLTKSINGCKEFLRIQRKISAKVVRSGATLVLGVSPVGLIFSAGILNAFYLFFLWFSLRSLISRPLKRLAEDCLKLAAGTPIPKVNEITAELDALQNNFSVMSFQVIEDRRRRASFLDLFGSRQASMLLDVRLTLSKFASSYQLDDKVRRRLTAMISNLNALEELLKSMTAALSRANSREIVISPRLVQSDELLQQCKSGVEALLERQQVTLELNNDDFSVELDPELIRRVLLNLVSNAVKYSPAAGKIILTARAESDSAIFTVKDEGPGISVEGQEKLFKRYGQLSALDGVKRAGTGLGLVICKEIVEAHQGEIGCESTPGTGSCFWFRIPLRQAKINYTPSSSLEVKARNPIPRQKSIFSTLWLVLLIFAIVQSALFIRLEQMFSDLTTRAANFASLRETVLETQDIFMRQVLWGQRLQLLALKRDITAVPQVIGSLSKIAKDFQNLYSGNFEEGVRQDAAHIIQLHDKTLDLLREFKQNIDVVFANSESYRTRMTDLVKPTENAFVALIRLLRANFDASYDWSHQLRSEILFAIIAAAAADVCLILFALLSGIGTAKTISLLNSKAKDFAGGKHISPSIKGENELALLDKSLCEVASEIHNAEAERQELLAVINHDLRTPLTSILGSLELFAGNAFGELPGDPHIFEKAREDLKSLLMQVNDLLALEKIDSGAYSIIPEKVSIKDSIETVVKSADKCRIEKSASINLNLEEELEKSMFFGDKDLLLRLITLLVQNALSYCNPGSTINIDVQKSEDGFVFQIKNNGPEIDKALLPVLFDRFRFVDGKPVPGLGLPLAYRICRLHGGTLEVNETGPAGTSIKFTLPESAMPVKDLT
jgi:signal transduction histidine kinase